MRARTVIAACAAIVLTLGLPVPARALEQAPEAQAKSFAGDRITGPNWEIKPQVARDGFSRVFTLKTPYGEFEVVGQRRLDDRLNELRALDALEKMSKSEMFVKALAKAGLAPLRFGRDLITNPIETTENLFAGVANVFDRAAAEIDQANASKDGTFESLVGVSKARRALAFELGVDAYSDFKPLSRGLDDVAGAVAAGDLSVRAAFSAISGGAGTAISGTATANQLSTPLRDKSSAEIAAQVETDLLAMGVAGAEIQSFLTSDFYSPADHLAVTAALKTLDAKDPGTFLSRAARARSVDDAKFQRARVEAMAAHSAKLGTVKAFESVGDYTLARNAKGELVAVFPFDEIIWTEQVAGSFDKINTAIAAAPQNAKPILGTSAEISTEANAMLTKQGWQIVKF
ncbi:MAG TPA: hypothetical protein DCL54_05970 [Alphaproteobacteria bacterium]|nr:hypothetical protein [Alphaproteobacteria bacterium]HAJ46110.1 hypothetical protein [Alphaproteobacteria bacterium]